MISQANHLTEMSAEFRWQQQEFTLQIHISEDCLFLGPARELYLNGRLLLRHTGCRCKHNQKTIFTDTEGQDHTLHFHTVNRFNIWLDTLIQIDDEIVFASLIPVKGWYTTLLIYLPILFLLGVSLGKLLGLLTISFSF